MSTKLCCSRCGGTIKERKFARQQPADVDPCTGETTPASCLPPDAATYASTQEAEFTGWLHNYTTKDHGHCYNLVLAENDKERAKQGALTRHKAATSYKPPRKRPAAERPSLENLTVDDLNDRGGVRRLELRDSGEHAAKKALSEAGSSGTKTVPMDVEAAAAEVQPQPQPNELGGFVTAARAAAARVETGQPAKAARLEGFDERTDPSRKVNDRFLSDAEKAHKSLRVAFAAQKREIDAAIRSAEEAQADASDARAGTQALAVELASLRATRQQVDDSQELLAVMHEAAEMLAEAGLANFPELFARAVKDGDISVKSIFARRLSEDSVNVPKDPKGWRFTAKLKRWYAYAYQCQSGRSCLEVLRGDVNDPDSLGGVIPSATTLLKEYLRLAPQVSGEILRQNIADHVEWMRLRERRHARMAIDATDIGVDEEPDIDDRTHTFRGTVNLSCVGEYDPGPLQEEYRRLMQYVEAAVASEELDSVKEAVRRSAAFVAFHLPAIKQGTTDAAETLDKRGITYAKRNLRAQGVLAPYQRVAPGGGGRGDGGGGNGGADDDARDEGARGAGATTARPASIECRQPTINKPNPRRSVDTGALRACRR